MMKNILKKNVTAIMACVLILSQNINFDLCGMMRSPSYNRPRSPSHDSQKPTEEKKKMLPVLMHNQTHNQIPKEIKGAITEKNGITYLEISQIIKNYKSYRNIVIDNKEATTIFQFDVGDYHQMQNIKDFVESENRKNISICDIQISNPQIPSYEHSKQIAAINYLFIAYWINKLTGIRINKNTFKANLKKGHIISDECAIVLEGINLTHMICYMGGNLFYQGTEEIDIDQTVFRKIETPHIISTILNTQLLIKIVRDNKCFHEIIDWPQYTPNMRLLDIMPLSTLFEKLFFDENIPEPQNYIDIASDEYHKLTGSTGWPINNPHHSILEDIITLPEDFTKTEDLEEYIKKIIERVISDNPRYEKAKENENFCDLFQIEEIDYTEKDIIKKNFQELAKDNPKKEDVELISNIIQKIIKDRVENNQNIAKKLIYFMKKRFHHLIELEKLEKEEKLKQRKNKQEEEKSSDEHNQITEQKYNNCSKPNRKQKQKKSLKKSQAVPKRVNQIFESLKAIALKENYIKDIKNFIDNNLYGNNCNAEVKSLNDALKNINTQYRINLKGDKHNNQIQILNVQGEDVLATGQMYKNKRGQSTHNKINTPGKNLIKTELSELIYNEFEDTIDDLIKDIKQCR